jgi:hypothetical protein
LLDDERQEHFDEEQVVREGEPHVSLMGLHKVPIEYK